MSGGVDSSYAAYLLEQQGHRVVGLTMAVFGGEPGAPADAGHGCYGPSEQDDILSARRVCEQLGIVHHTIDLRDEYRRAVLDYFRAEYLQGRTPNPCTRCNPVVKFGFLLQRASEQGIGFDRFATGHYARGAWRATRRAEDIACIEGWTVKKTSRTSSTV
jgi:tRNA-specific 2-thiouridylase